MNYFFCMIVLGALMDPYVIFDFNTDSDLRDWVIVDDVVMGGRSSGAFSVGREGHGVFEGTVSLENNGGFSSLRYGMSKILIGDYKKVVLTLKGDGRAYQFRVKSNSRDYYSYIYSFVTSGEWEEIEVPLSAMYPGFRGRKLDRPNFNNAHIEEIRFLIGNKKPESFKLLIDKIELR